MNKALRLTALLAALALTSAAGEDKLVASAPENMSWSVIAAPPGTEDKTNPDREVRVEGAQAKGLRMFSRRDAKGGERTYFLVRDFLLGPDADGRIVVAASADQSAAAASPLSLPTQPGGFAEFGWVRADQYRGIADFAGHRCAKYEELKTETGGDGLDSGMTNASSPPTNHEASPSQRPTVLRTAYVDIATRLPVALIDQSGSYEYRFAPLTKPLVLPPDYAAALRETEQRLEKARNRYRIPQ